MIYIGCLAGVQSIQRTERVNIPRLSRNPIRCTTMPFDVLAVTKAFLEDYPLLPLPFYSFVDTLNYVKQSSFADKVAEAALLGERVLNATKCTLELRSSNIPLCISKVRSTCWASSERQS